MQPEPGRWSNLQRCRSLQRRTGATRDCDRQMSGELMGRCNPTNVPSLQQCQSEDDRQLREDVDEETEGGKEGKA